jgi:site-specific DNA-methyltransferase (cytosine-N4-specific)
MAMGDNLDGSGGRAQGGAAAARVQQAQLRLPLLRVLDAYPRGLPAHEAVAAVAEAVGVAPDVARVRVPLPSGGDVEVFGRNVRWARQRAKLAGQVDGTTRNLWRLTPKGQRDLRNASPGLVVTVFTTPTGRALWAEAEAGFGTLQDRSVNLWVTSPPYPLQFEKAYGNRRGAEYLEWLTGIGREMHRTLTDDGSLFLNLGDCWERGRPVMSLYQERLLLALCDDVGFRLAQRLVWHNPARLPGPAEWVTVRRCRVTAATEHVWWLAKTDYPKADNRRVLRAYSASMRRRQERGGEVGAVRPSGHALRRGAFGADRGGSIPQNLIAAANTVSNGAYMRHCRERDLPVHPARFPEALAELPIRLCTEEQDLVGDPFAGSCTTAAVAERLKRRWLAVDRSLSYLQGAAGRFPHAQLALRP